MEEVKIETIDHDIAFRIDNTIYLNYNLRKYPKLLNYLIEHEINHKPGKFTLHDLLHDFKDLFSINQFKLLLFTLRYPRAFSNILPVTKFRGEYCINYSLVTLYTIIIIILVLM